jgi:2-hydroxychromene-2-carboxylate isomerase
MTAHLDFYFDFSSPYGYLAAERIDDLAARYGRSVLWHPVLLGVIFQRTGAVPLTEAPLKGDYSRRDFARSARFLGLPFRMPSRFPLPTQAAARAFYWLWDQDPEQARAFGRALYRALFVDDRDISAPDTVLDLARAEGLDAPALEAALAGPELKARLKAEVEAALARGVCGSPFIVVDGEPFLGADRLPQLERWLAAGPGGF